MEFGIILGLLAATIRMTVPIVLPAIGGLISERSGILNIGLEAMIAAGAFGGAAISLATGNPYIGILGALVSGIIIAAAFSIFTVRFGGNQVIVGLGFNFMLAGLLPFLSTRIFSYRGGSPGVPGVATVKMSSFKISVFEPLIILVPLLAYVLLYKTDFGYKVRAVGREPFVADVSGIRVFRLKYACVLISGALAGLGGAYLALSVANRYTMGISAGKGFVAIAAIRLGNWKPVKIMWASFFFAFLYALQIAFQGSWIPTEFFLMAPYLGVIAVLGGIVGGISPPSEFEPYIRD
ncbi:MAG: ABC transporter permease [Candidatus Bipolaricaulota bacterium]|nr:ABC transporter permease [Candidatus Bipolaricaulota bacterium]